LQARQQSLQDGFSGRSFFSFSSGQLAVTSDGRRSIHFLATLSISKRFFKLACGTRMNMTTVVKPRPVFFARSLAHAPLPLLVMRKSSATSNPTRRAPFGGT
jgi:hypothetical protein